MLNLTPQQYTLPPLDKGDHITIINSTEVDKKYIIESGEYGNITLILKHGQKINIKTGSKLPVINIYDLTEEEMINLSDKTKALT